MQLSYIITGFAPSNVNDKFVEAKKYFGSLIQFNGKEGVVISQNTAHVTLKRKFYLKVGVEEKVVVRALDGIKFKPVLVKAKRLTVFRSPHLGNILVAWVDKNPGLMGLHAELSGVVDRYIEFEVKTFLPHMSILYHLPENRIDEAKEYIKKKIMPIVFTLDNFSLLKDTEVIKERVPVKGYYP